LTRERLTGRVRATARLEAFDACGVDESDVGTREAKWLLKGIADERRRGEVNSVSPTQAVPREQLFDASMYIVVDRNAPHAEPLGLEGAVCALDVLGICGYIALLAREGGRHLVVEDL
jgi:hypothetical protein